MRAPDRLYLLDLLRGLAALAVIVFHWQFWGSDSHRIAPLGGFPFPRAIGEAALAFLYQCGASAVGLFFTLSGFVFFWLFRDAVRDRRTSGWNFFVDRFSRLYPLHLATLILVAIGQYAYASMNGGLGWVSHVNDALGFLRNLLVVPLWTPTRLVAFNLPVWSLSVEALVYVVFFFVARSGRLGVLGTIAMVALGVLANAYSTDIGYGVTSFFMGGLAYVAYERVTHARVERPLAIVVIASWIGALAFGAGLVNLSTTPVWWLEGRYATYVLFPATVLTLAILETRRGPMAARLRWVGDATYSMYLLGFPAMLAVAVTIKGAGGSSEGMKSPLALLAFLAAIAPLALASHFGFERPAQRWLRRTLSARTRPDARPAPSSTP